MLRLKREAGFTIVELLIVVVVIAILAAITIVSYNGIQNRATNSAVQSELNQVVKKVEAFKITNASSLYPADLATASLSSASSAGTLSYYYAPDSDTYCAQIVKGTNRYVASNINRNAVAGTCSETGLLGWWKLNGDGTDSSSNNNNGVLANTTNVTGENGVANNALAFDFPSGSGVTISNSAALNDSPQTFSFWVNPTNWSTGTASVFLTKRNAGAGNGYFIAYVNGLSTMAFDCGGSPQRWGTGYVPPLGQWTHIMLTCSMKGNLALYVNGVLTGTKSNVDRSLANESNIPLRIGQESASTYVLNGSMDDVRIYNRVLTSGEAMQLYTAHAQ